MTHLCLWTVFSLLVLLLLLGLAALLLADRRISFPAALTERIEARINAGITGGEVGLGRIDILVDRRGVPRLSAHDVDLRDSGGVGIARVGDVGASFDPVALVRGEWAIRRLNLTGAEVTLRRASDGSFSLSFGQGARNFAGLGGLLDAMDAQFDAAPFDVTDRIVAEGLTVVVEDARSSRVWQVFGGRLRLDRTKTGLDLTFWAEIFNGTDDLAVAELSLTTERSSGAAVLAAKIDGVPAGDIALQTPALSFLSVIDAPISGSLRATLGADGDPTRLQGTLDMGAGRVQPTPAAQPLQFDTARAAFDYDAAAAKISFTELAAHGELLGFSASGHTYLTEIGPDGWPGALVSQLAVSEVDMLAEGLFENRVAFEAGAVDLRFRADPFRVEIGQAVLMPAVDVPEEHLRLRGTVWADAQGWNAALDLKADTLPFERLVALWPEPVAPNARKWIATKIKAGTIRDLTGALRLAPGEKPTLATSLTFEGGAAQFLPEMPMATGLGGYLAILGERITIALDGGTVQPAAGGAIALAGSTLVIPNRNSKPSRGLFEVKTESSLASVLSLLTYPPIRMFAENDPPEIGTARAALTSRFEIPIGRKMLPGEFSYAVGGALTGVVSDTLVEGRRLTASSLAVDATPAAVMVSGQALLDGVPVTGRWRQGNSAEEKGRSEVRGTIELSQNTADAFGIALPAGSLAGAGQGEFRLVLSSGTAPRFVLTSALSGLRMRLDAIGWTKPANQSGNLTVEGRLGKDPVVSKLEISGSGLTAAGALDLGPGGSFRGARFSRVRVGGWLDAPVTLTARGGNRPPAIRLGGGTYDMRRSQLGGSGGSSQGHGPVEVVLDRLVVSDGITLTAVRGSLAAGTANTGEVTAQVNGGTPIRAELAGGTVRITAEDAGGAIRDAGLLGNARGGALNLVLKPAGRNGTYDGSLKVTGTRVLDAPAMAELLNALSLVGILDQLTGGVGILFDDVEASFRLTPDQIVLYQSSAIGASMGLSMDGVYDSNSKAMDMQGVVSPFYFVNVIGSIFTRKGEGLVGISFTLKGPTAKPNVAVNPLSILTPGMFREIFRRPAPERN